MYHKKLKVLSTLEFIQTNQNVILSGNPGTGKTHISNMTWYESI
ncbi:ATP-binding protein [Tepiditoga spiralis]